MTKTIFVDHHPLKGDLPIIHLLDIRRFSREGLIGFVAMEPENFIFQGGFFFNQIFYAKMEIIHENI
jgi:hypothetical protein